MEALIPHWADIVVSMRVKTKSASLAFGLLAAVAPPYITGLPPRYRAIYTFIKHLLHCPGQTVSGEFILIKLSS